jgi:hypothetical protein
MPNILLCRHFIECNYPPLLKAFDSLASKLEAHGECPMMLLENWHEINLTPDEWDVLIVLLKAIKGHLREES